MSRRRRDGGATVWAGLLAAAEAVGKVMGPAAANLDLWGVTVPASVLDVDALHRHLRTARLLEDHLRDVVEVVAAALHAARPGVTLPGHLARTTGQPDTTVVERHTTQVVVALTTRTGDLQGHGRTLDARDAVEDFAMWHVSRFLQESLKVTADRDEVQP